MLENATTLATAATPRIEYGRLDAAGLPKHYLGAVTFGTARPAQSDPRCVRVGLSPLRGDGLVEVWRASGPVNIGFDGIVRYAADPNHMLGAIELDERRYGGIEAAAEAAYTALSRFVTASPHPHLLRIWNYFDAITRGDGDNERYKLFCRGRAAGLHSINPMREEHFPAATCIGRRDGDPTLQVYWLAGRAPGVPLENPRQISAYRYPREYGPTPPSFSRAMLASDRLIMISGTASIVGHVSRHHGDVTAQLEELLANLTSLLQRAHAVAPRLPPTLGTSSILKFYLRDAAAMDRVEALLRERLPPQTPYMILDAEICRSDLLIEADCLHGAS